MRLASETSWQLLQQTLNKKMWPPVELRFPCLYNMCCFTTQPLPQHFSSLQLTHNTRGVWSFWQKSLLTKSWLKTLMNYLQVTSSHSCLNLRVMACIKHQGIQFTIINMQVICVMLTICTSGCFNCAAHNPGSTVDRYQVLINISFSKK